MLLPLTILLFSWSTLVHAGGVHLNGPCNVLRNRLQLGSYQFYSECDSQTYCSGTTGTCQKRTCRRADFPFGYSQGDPGIPDKCPKGQFCPDEEDACQPLLPVGSPCQLNRDDQCQAPPNFKELADTSNQGSNFNGSVCLQNVCMWANVTLGLACLIENTPYIGYGLDGSEEFINIVSRGNCILGLYCDSQQLICMSNKALGAACGADKECDTGNCLGAGVCGQPAETPNRFPSWVYVVVVFGLLGGMFGTLFGMYIFHRYQRDKERERRAQYWREQNTFRQNILQMRDTATTILQQPTAPSSQRSTIYGGSNESSQASMLHHGMAKGSGLRHYTNDYEDSGYTPQHAPIHPRSDGRF